MRAARLVSLLLLLQQRGRATAESLAEELEVSPRTIYRDLEALGAAGVPVVAEPGRHGGYQLLGGYRTRLTGLTAKEAQALVAAGVTGPMGELGLGTVLGAAQLKLLASLPKELADRAAAARQRFHYDAPGWFRGSREDPHLAALAGAVWDDLTVAVDYRHPGSAAPSARTLDPLGLVCKSGIWYLVARRDGELRTYRVSRIQSLAVQDQHFERPDDFDLAAFWHDTVATVESLPPPVEVIVEATESACDSLRRMSHNFGPVLGTCDPLDEDDRPGWLRCELTFETLDDAYFGLIRLGGDVVVRAPEELRERMHDTVRALFERYGP